jgi:hypothetical protein
MRAVRQIFNCFAAVLALTLFAEPGDLAGPLGVFSGKKVAFLCNKKGEIDRIAVPLEPAVDDIIFIITRVVESQLPRE